MNEQNIKIASYTTTSIECPCGQTRFQIPDVIGGEKVICDACGREFEIVLKVRISEPKRKNITRMLG